jgi:hypothetical protein
MTAGAEDPHIGLVVEGRGENESAPQLLRTHLYSREEYRDILSSPVVCHGRGKALRHSGIEGFVATAAGRPGCRAVLVILDADEDAACELGPEILARAQAVTAKPVVVCLAEPTYEEWLLASAETLELDGLTFVASRNPESLIRSALPVKYVKPTWQPRLTARMDIALAASRSPSLSRLLARLESLVETTLPPPPNAANDDPVQDAE